MPVKWVEPFLDYEEFTKSAPSKTIQHYPAILLRRKRIGNGPYTRVVKESYPMSMELPLIFKRIVFTDIAQFGIYK
jgi:hypothetical protein